MRLTATQREYVLQATRQHFGVDANVWLFGSRANEARRGGDVDLYVETAQPDTRMSTLRCKIAFEDSLDFHVDLIVNNYTRCAVMTEHLRLITKQLTH